MSIVKDIDDILQPYRRKLRRALAVGMAAVLASGVGGGVYAWTSDYREALLFHILAGMVGGGLLVYSMLSCGVQGQNIVITDDDLGRLARLPISERESFDRLTSLLEEQGCLYLPQVEEFTQTERDERTRCARLTRHGASALLQK